MINNRQIRVRCSMSSKLRQDLLKYRETVFSYLFRTII
uniref:Uncharacterized protein n=1 Tax=Anguilla anguilla TaxID=7936 RepID=A0A0E9RTT6_ANGAN